MFSVMNVMGYVACGFLGLLAATIIAFIWLKKINLSSLISEANGQASMSRFQLLIFTFVIAIGLFTLVEKRGDGTFPPIPDGVLTLLGISAGTYAVGKGISYSQPDIMKAPTVDAVAAQKSAQVAAAHADAARSAANASQASADQSASTIEVARRAATQTVVSAVVAQHAADESVVNAAVAQQAADIATDGKN